MFRANGRLSYEIQISVQEPPLIEDIPVVLNVPESFLQALSMNNSIEVFTLRENAGGEELPFTLFEIEEQNVQFNVTSKTVAFDLPGAAFILSNTTGLYVAVVTLSSTPGGSNAITRRLVKGECKAVSIRCPVANGCTVTSPFQKNRKHPKTGKLEDHWGTDYRAAIGTAVLAAADGTIELATSKNGYGNTIILRHSDKAATLYAHLS
jgi:murein DD-endopeptidase MepM/ murein hydrolase activator NlpD